MENVHSVIDLQRTSEDLNLLLFHFVMEKNSSQNSRRWFHFISHSLKCKYSQFICLQCERKNREVGHSIDHMIHRNVEKRDEILTAFLSFEVIWIMYEWEWDLDCFIETKFVEVIAYDSRLCDNIYVIGKTTERYDNSSLKIYSFMKIIMYIYCIT